MKESLWLQIFEVSEYSTCIVTDDDENAKDTLQRVDVVHIGIFII